MIKGYSMLTWRAMLAGILALSAGATPAADTGQDKVVDGVAVYIGVMPA